MSYEPESERKVSHKICAGCGQEVDASMEVGGLYWCERSYRLAGVKIKRTPLWSFRAPVHREEGEE